MLLLHRGTINCTFCCRLLLYFSPIFFFTQARKLTTSSISSGPSQVSTQAEVVPTMHNHTHNHIHGGHSTRPVPVSSVSSFFQLSAFLNNGQIEPLVKYEGRVCLVVNMASADSATKHELTQVCLS